MRVLILGCGPAGLIAAQSADLMGADVTIFSRKVKSPIYGAQYLHEPIEGVSPKDPEGMINFVMLGTPEGYAEKLFGDPLRKSGWWQYCETPMVPAWDIRTAYEKMWATFESRIVDKELDAEEVARIDWDSWDYIFNTVPLWNICERYKAGHSFDKYKVLIQPAHEGAIDSVHRVIYNGRPEDKWFRSSVVFGIDGGYEYPIDAEVQNATMIRKPLRTNCDCWPHIHRLGRYGAWDMNRLTHDSFHIVREVIGGQGETESI